VSNLPEYNLRCLLVYFPDGGPGVAGRNLNVLNVEDIRDWFVPTPESLLYCISSGKTNYVRLMARLRYCTSVPFATAAPNRLLT
jgi:hypothetical protein